jgi:hypothetical protein
VARPVSKVDRNEEAGLKFSFVLCLTSQAVFVVLENDFMVEKLVVFLKWSEPQRESLTVNSKQTWVSRKFFVPESWGQG